jgi:hypothetical protein
MFSILIEQYLVFLSKLRASVNDKHVTKLLTFLIEYFPRAIDFVEIAFGPKQICFHLIVIGILQFAALAIDVTRSATAQFFSMFTLKGIKQNNLMYKMSKAKSYSEWKSFASELDKLKGADIWQKTDQSYLYDHRVLKKRIQDTIHMIRHGDIFNLMFRLRGGLARDQFGINHEALFTKAIAGTKHIIEAYNETVAYALNFVCDSPIGDEEIPTDAKLAFFNETRHSYGRTAILFSGGAYLGSYHVGVARALWKEGMLPRVMSGASAGSLTVMILGTRTNEEIDEFFTQNGERDFRVDFLVTEKVINSKVGRTIQSWIPTSLRWMMDPFLCLLFEQRFANIDREHFKEVVKFNVGLITFQVTSFVPSFLLLNPVQTFHFLSFHRKRLIEVVGLLISLLHLSMPMILQDY